MCKMLIIEDLILEDGGGKGVYGKFTGMVWEEERAAWIWAGVEGGWGDRLWAGGTGSSPGRRGDSTWSRWRFIHYNDKKEKEVWGGVEPHSDPQCLL